jgi:hypothetical protein
MSEEVSKEATLSVSKDTKVSVGIDPGSFLVSRSDWSLLYKRVDELKDLHSWMEIAKNTMWLCIGLAPPSALAWIASVSAYQQKPDNLQNVAAYLAGAITVASIIAGVGAFLVQRSISDQARREVRHVIEDMDRMYAPHALPAEKEAAGKG